MASTKKAFNWTMSVQHLVQCRFGSCVGAASAPSMQKLNCTEHSSIFLLTFFFQFNLVYFSFILFIFSASVKSLTCSHTGYIQ